MKIEELQIEISIKDEEEIKSKLASIKQDIEEVASAARDLNSVLDEINEVQQQGEVILCKDCEYYCENTDGYGVCTRKDLFGDVVKDTDYCSRAKERKDEE